MPEEASPGEVSLLLNELQKDSPEAASKLAALVNRELRQTAADHIRKQEPGHTLPATALVNEVFLKLVAPEERTFQSRAQFLGVASNLMRQILVKSARRRLATRRLSGQPNPEIGANLVFASDAPTDVLALDEALKALQKVDPQQSQIKELRSFGGLTVAETAEYLGVSQQTVTMATNEPITEDYRPAVEKMAAGTKILHYKVIERLGRGGMGSVYKAHDQRLDRIVALKILSQKATPDPEHKRRFVQEARAASALNHPNIVTIYEIAEVDGVDLIAMEYVAGQTLGQLTGTKGLDAKDVLAYAVQIADALEAAHAVGIVHRDLKPANIMVTATGRIKVVDFGLAKVPAEGKNSEPLETIGIQRPLSIEGVIAGTPAYMSPEQAQGLAVDPRSDIFSFGAVLYKLVTGASPFEGADTVSILVAVVHDEPKKITALVPSTPTELAGIIDRALRKDPGQRWQSMTDLKSALERVRESPPTMKRKSRNVLVYFVPLAVALGLIGIPFISQEKTESRARQDVPGTIAAANSVAVLGFKNTTGDESKDWLSDDLARILADNLSIGNQLLVIPAREVALAARELQVKNIDSPSHASLLQLRRRLNAAFVVSGSYLTSGKQTGGQVQLRLRLLDTASGKTLVSTNDIGTEDDVFKMVGRPSDRLRAELGVSPVAHSDLSGAFTSVPADPAAARPYIEALKRMDQFDTLGSIPLFKEAIAAAPKYALIHADLADAWSQLGYDENARKEAQSAFELSASLSPQQRSLVEARYREITGEWDKALEIYRSLWIRFPNQPQFGFRLATTQTAAGRGRDALSTLSAVRKLQSAGNPDPRVDLQSAEAYETLADFRSARDAATQAASFAEKSGAKLLLARARLIQCWASLNLGEPKEAISACQEARQINESLGNRSGVARSVNNIANALARQGDSAGAKVMYEQALTISRQIRDKINTQGALDNLAILRSRQGDLAGARELYAQALQIAVERGNKVEIARLWNNIGNTYHKEANLVETEKAYAQALAMARETGNEGTVARVLYNRGIALVEQGNLKAAMNDFNESLEIRKRLALRTGIAGTQVAIAMIKFIQGNLDDASSLYQQALTTQKELGEKRNAPYTEIDLAQVALERGRAREAETAFRRIADDCKTQQYSEQEALARVGLARALLSEKRLQEAQTEMKRAYEVGGNSSDFTVRLTLSIASARLNAALGQHDSATTSLQELLSESSGKGLVGFQLEARLAMGEVMLLKGKKAVGREMLRLLQQEAAARGFVLIARKANFSDAARI